MPKMHLTPKQQRLFQVITEFVKTNSQSPTLGELKRILDFKYTNSVVHLLKKLEKKGLIKRNKGQYRGIELLNEQKETVEIPLVGNVACGTPFLAQENIEAYIPYNTSKLKGDPKDHFFLRASGDSMNRAGIDDGDFVLVKKQSYAEPGDKVVTLIGEEATIKRFKREEGHISLEPDSDNPKHKRILIFKDASESTMIQGVVYDVIRPI